MLSRTSFHVLYGRVEILTDEAVSCGTLTKDNEKRKGVEEINCRAPYKQVAPINAVRIGNNQRVYYECGSSDHLRNTCPKMNRAPGQTGNPLALEGNRNTRNNGNRATGMAFNVNVNTVEALRDPNIMTGTFSLNDHFTTVLFYFRADFSFISTKFAPLLKVKPSIVNPGYVIEVADGKKVKLDRIIRDCKLELGNSLFSINLIPLGHGSFDVIMGMDWLSQNKAVIVCHEKVVEIPLESSGIDRDDFKRIWIKKIQYKNIYTNTHTKKPNPSFPRKGKKEIKSIIPRRSIEVFPGRIPNEAAIES
nr:reverse transcriptase domain-containing protein [Tanacetum cinerariifolium]